MLRMHRDPWRPARPARIVAALAALVATLAACGGGDSSGSDVTVSSVKAATDAEKTAATAGTVTRGGASGPTTGAFRADPPAARVALPVFPGGAAVPTEALVVDGNAFLGRVTVDRATVDAAGADATTLVWLRLDGEARWLERPKAAVRILAAPALLGPFGTLDLLESTQASLTPLGDDKVGGTAVTHYGVTLTPLARSSGIERAEVWADADRRLRRVLVVTKPTGANEATTTDYTVEYPAQIDVQAPDASDVTTSADRDGPALAPAAAYSRIAGGDDGGVQWTLEHAPGTESSNCFRLTTSPALTLVNNTSETCIETPPADGLAEWQVDFPFSNPTGQAADVVVGVAFRDTERAEFRFADETRAPARAVVPGDGYTAIVWVGPADPAVGFATIALARSAELSCGPGSITDPAEITDPDELARAREFPWSCTTD